MGRRLEDPTDDIPEFNPLEFLSKPFVMIIDDMGSTRAVLRDMLKGMGFEEDWIVEAESGEDALSKLEQIHPDLIISDLHMKGLSGIDLLRQIRSRPYLIDTPFLLLTVSYDARQVVEAMSLGASDYLLKPISFMNLRHKVELALSRPRTERAL